MAKSRKSKKAPPCKVVTRARAIANIPEHERSLHEPKARSDLRRALAWARGNRPKDSDPDAIFESLESRNRSK
jgi:hypothetical protein